MTIWALLVVLLLQTPPASLQGVVLKAGTEEPLARATVELRSTDTADSRVRTTTTANDGRFVFSGVSLGQYQLTVTRIGYVKATYGERKPGGPGTPVAIPDTSGIRVSLTPAAIISGRIYDRQGQPIGNATVNAMRVSFLQGRRSLSVVQSTITNDLGEYRLFTLTPGRYYVGANSGIRGVGGGAQGSDRLLVFRAQRERTRTEPVPTEDLAVPIYFPGTPDELAAAPIDLEPGSEIRNIDFVVAPLRALHIRGVVTTNEPGQTVNGEVQLRLASGTGARFTSSPQPTFDLTNVTSGRYILSATSGTMSGRTSIEVFDQDLNNVTITVSHSLNIPGRILVEGASPENSPPDVKTLRITLFSEPSDGGRVAAPTPAADGSFLLQTVPLGTYRVSVNPVMQNGYVKSVRLGNSEGIHSGITVQGPAELTIVVSAKPGTVQGRVFNERNEPLPNAMTVLIPDNELRTRTDLFRNAMTSPSGEFKFQGLTPGNYKLLAWEEVESGAWLNSEFMRNYEERGTTVIVTEGSTANIELKALRD